MVEIVTTALSCLLAGGIGSFLFIKQERKSKDIENEARQSDEWKKLFEETKAEVRERDSKIDELIEIMEKHRLSDMEREKKMIATEVENTRCKLLMCEVPSCPNRQPKTGY